MHLTLSAGTVALLLAGAALAQPGTNSEAPVLEPSPSFSNPNETTPPPAATTNNETPASTTPNNEPSPPVNGDVIVPLPGSNSDTHIDTEPGGNNTTTSDTTHPPATTTANIPVPTQDHPAPRNVPGFTAPSNPAVKTAVGNNPGAPFAGANSFTAGQAKARIESRGYSDVSSLAKDSQGIWRGKAQKEGQTVAVALDYQGNVVSP
jgi:hypothetical protein